MHPLWFAIWQELLRAHLVKSEQPVGSDGASNGKSIALPVLQWADGTSEPPLMRFGRALGAQLLSAVCCFDREEHSRPVRAARAVFCRLKLLTYLSGIVPARTSSQEVVGLSLRGTSLRGEWALCIRMNCTWLSPGIGRGAGNHPTNLLKEKKKNPEARSSQEKTNDESISP